MWVCNECKKEFEIGSRVWILTHLELIGDDVSFDDFEVYCLKDKPEVKDEIGQVLEMGIVESEGMIGKWNIK